MPAPANPTHTDVDWLSPIILLCADVLGRVLDSPSELQVGVVLGVVGAPAFILLVRRKDLAQL